MPRTARSSSIAVLALVALLAPTAATAAAAGKTTASFRFTPVEPKVGATLVLDARGSKCAAKPCKYLWTARATGKKTIKLGTKAKASLKLSAAGTVVVTLKLTDKRRRSASFKRSIVVAALPPSFTPTSPPPLAATTFPLPLPAPRTLATPAIGAPAEGALLASSTVLLSGTSEPGSAVEITEGGVSRGTASADAGGSWSLQLAGVADGVHAYVARASDAGGNASAGSAPRSVRVDTLAPGAPVIAEPADGALLASADATVSGTAEPRAALEVRVDGVVKSGTTVGDDGRWSVQLAGLADGTRTLSARAVDAAGHASAAAARAVRIDTTPPDTALSSGPAGEIPEDRAEFRFSSDDAAARFDCRFDGPDGAGEWKSCESPARYGALADGGYSFSVRAVDEAGHEDATPANRAFGVRAPETDPAMIFLAPDGEDRRACTAPNPCKSLKRGYDAAAAEATIELDAGYYGDQELPAGEKQLTVRSATGARVELRNLDVYANDVMVRGLRLEKLNVRGSRQTYDGVEIDAKFARHPALEHWRGNDNTFKNGRIGNVVNEKGVLVGEHRWTFDNVEFHDVVVNDPLVHNECMFATGAEGLTVRNSTFHDCATMNLFFTNYEGGPAYGRVTLENNVFEHTNMDKPGSWHHYTIGVHEIVGALRDWVVRNNTFETGVAIGPKTGTGRWVGNLGDWDCIEGVEYRYNVGMACDELDSGVFPAASTEERPAAFGWVDPGKRDFRLKPDSPALDAADPLDFPSTDRDGVARPKGWGPDAGAYETG